MFYSWSCAVRAVKKKSLYNYDSKHNAPTIYSVQACPRQKDYYSIISPEIGFQCDKHSSKNCLRHCLVNSSLNCHGVSGNAVSPSNKSILSPSTSSTSAFALVAAALEEGARARNAGIKFRHLTLANHRRDRESLDNHELLVESAVMRADLRHRGQVALVRSHWSRQAE